MRGEGGSQGMVTGFSIEASNTEDVNFENRFFVLTTGSSSHTMAIADSPYRFF